MTIDVRDRFVFLGGLHRSGTSLLASLLAQHPQICGFSDTGAPEDEGQHLQSVYATDMAHGGPGRFAFDSGAHLTEASELASPQNAQRLKQQWDPYWAGGDRLFLEKSPPNLIRARFLQSLFPHAAFLFIVRHPVATSVATYKWSGTGIYSLLHHWVVGHQMLCDDLPHVRRALVVCYESLTTDPSLCLQGIEHFLGLAPYDGYVSKLDSNVNDSYFREWGRRFLTTRDRSKPVPPSVEVHAHKRPWWQQGWKRLAKKAIHEHVFGEARQLSHAHYEAQDAVAMFEDDVRRWGYSLLDTQYRNTQAFRARISKHAAVAC